MLAEDRKEHQGFIYRADFLSEDEADQWFVRLRDELEWRQDRVQVFGRSHQIPRLQVFLAETGLSYTYSKLKLTGTGFPDGVRHLKDRIEQHTGYRFNALLGNLYRTGEDRMGWHADNEPELGSDPVIASLSLGATRTLRVRERSSSKRSKPASSWSIDLEHGSLLIMGPGTQQRFQHALPRRSRCVEPRINLTFRYIKEQT